MINAIDSDAVMRIIPKNLPGFYEVSTLDGDEIIIKRRFPRAKPLVDDGKAKNEAVSKSRLTD